MNIEDWFVFGIYGLSPVPASNPHGVGVASEKTIVKIIPVSKLNTIPPLSCLGAFLITLVPVPTTDVTSPKKALNVSTSWIKFCLTGPPSIPFRQSTSKYSSCFRISHINEAATGLPILPDLIILIVSFTSG